MAIRPLIPDFPSSSLPLGIRLSNKKGTGSEQSLPCAAINVVARCRSSFLLDALRCAPAAWQAMRMSTMPADSVLIQPACRRRQGQPAFRPPPIPRPASLIRRPPLILD